MGPVLGQKSNYFEEKQIVIRDKPFSKRPFSRLFTCCYCITKVLLILFLISPQLFVNIREKKLTKSDFSNSSNVIVPPSAYPLDLKIHKNIISIKD